MIEHLITLLLPLTLLLSILLAGHKWLIQSLGASNTYLLWLMVPLGLVIYSLPLPWQQNTLSNVAEIKRYWVKPAVTLQQHLSVAWMFYIWLSVVVSMMAYWLLTYSIFNKQLKLTNIDKSSMPLAIPQKVSLYQSSSTYSPMLIGLVKQKLIIPENFSELYSVEQQKLILEHEICHFDRNDIYWNLMALTCLTLFWFHPLAWLAYFRFRQDQELSCDQLVLARKPKESRINYSKALLVAAQSTPSLAFAQLSFKKHGDKQIMLERINNLKTNKKTSKSLLIVAILTTITLLSGLSYAGNQHDNVGEKATESTHLKPVMRVNPKYPIKAAQEGMEGSVVLKFDVTANGSVTNVEVVNAKPAYVFDKSAVSALEKWKYSAVGHKVEGLLVQLDFSMGKDSKLENLIERIKVTQ
ncbi:MULTISPECIES: M56 family metallopeptidase [unclassified Colwellia]|uniref:M56 family metallopeptidase n=1 Tax=unclassified Colwellia TaxID=196834 RepID=UPI0015F7841A|nr:MULTISPECIES: M56 family metallopeptidase [unclassified Colwellia]MBA6232137.1 M56 family metallopeptidase [Colwellia sp. MB02u-7]MBA6237165.1 M56 family metallopeptidase [Colwellia sp. MB02u-11]MBA6301571.1 M56 family metallopeptidase [Colwellia sp. MB3u-22]MBA6304767.1 M56 family metallopeptidase [Colwellia sp. MB02u-14]MBA6311457.1 M56 family metallopeptidase [Colwellia sp. MB3u-64]